MKYNHFFIVGAQKSGTTTIHNWLSNHPEICMSNPKEPKFIEWEYPKGVNYYLAKYFDHRTDECILGESRVFNLIIGYAPERIKEMFGLDTKIIILLRDPAFRFLSAVNHFQAMRPGREILTPEQAFFKNYVEFDLDYFNSEENFCSNRDIAGGPYRGMYLETGCYAYYIKKYIKAGFEILVTSLDQLKDDPKKTYYEICDFLDVERIPIDEFKPYNQKIYNIDRKLLNILRDFYDPYVKELNDIPDVSRLTRQWLYA